MAKNTSTHAYELLLDTKHWESSEKHLDTLIDTSKKKITDLSKKIQELNAEIATMNNGGAKDKKLKHLEDAKKQMASLENGILLLKDLQKATVTDVDILSRAMDDMAKHGTSAYSNLVNGIRQAKNELKNFAKVGYDGKDGMDQKKLTDFIRQATARMKEVEAGFDNVVSKVKKTGATSVDEGQKMISVLSEIRKTIDASTASGRKKMKEVDDAINKVTSDMERLSANSSDVAKALRSVDADGNITKPKTFSGSINELNRMKASLTSFSKTIDQTTEKGRAKFSQVNAAIQAIDVNLKKAEVGSKRFDEIVRNPKSASLHELEKVIQGLQEKYKYLVRGSKEYNRTVEQLRNAKKQMQELTDATKLHASALDNAIKRLKTYVMVYVGFQQVVNIMRNVFQSNLQLSDSLSDIQKRTRLSDAAIKDISKTLDGFDTRTAQSQLHELAATAGLLGLKSKDEIIGFTRAANQLSVALVELGSEGASQLMKIATLTGDVTKYGTEQALIKTGSAINELTASSAASAGPIVNFISRMGAVSSQANLTMGDIAGIGATLDALGQPIELSSTAMNRFIMALKGNTAGLATALNIDIGHLQKLIDDGNTMAAMLEVLNAMSAQKGGVSALGQVFTEMDSESVRLKQTIAALIGNVGFLEQQIAISNEAFNEGTSAINEYNIKNNNASAIMERTGNMIKEYFTNSDMVDMWRGIAVVINNIVSVLLRLGGVIKSVAAAWVGWKTALMLTEVSFAKMGRSVLSFCTNIPRVMSIAFTRMTMSAELFKLKTNQVATGLNRLKYAFGIISKANPFGAIASIVSILASILLPRLLASLGQNADTMSELAEYTDRLNENTAKYDAAGKEQSALFDMQTEALNKMTKGSEAYERQKARILKQYGNEFDALTKNIREMDLSSTQMKIFVDEMYDASESQILLANKLREAARETESLRAKMGMAANDTAAYKEAEEELAKSLEKENYLREQAKKYLGKQIEAEVAHVNSMSNECKWQQLLREEINKTAKARVHEAAVTDEMNAMNQITTSFRKRFVEQAMEMGMDENAAVEIAMQLLDNVVMGVSGVLSEKDLINKMKENVNMETANWFTRIFGDENNWNYTRATELLDIAKTAKKAFEQSKANLQRYKAWEQSAGNLTEEQQEYNMMQGGWDRKSYRKAKKTSLNRRSELLHAEWDKFGRGDDISEFNAYVGKEFADYDEALKWVESVTKEMKAVAKSRGWSLAGNWTWPTEEKESSHSKETTEMNNLMSGMLDKLKAYYADRKAIIERARYEEKISEKEKDREILQMDIDQNLAEEALRRDFAEKAGKEFKHLKGGLVSAIYGDPKEAGETLERLRKLMQQFGETTVDSILRKASENQLKVAELQAKNKQKLDEAIRQYDAVGLAVYNMAQNLDESGLLTKGMIADLDNIEEFQTVYAERIGFIFDNIENAYILNAATLREAMRDQGVGSWADAIMDEESAQLLINRMQDFLNTYEDAVRKEANKITKRIEQEYEQEDASGFSQKKFEESRKRFYDVKKSATDKAGAVAYFGDAQRFDGTGSANDVELEQIKLKIQLQYEYIQALQSRRDQEIANAKNYEECKMIEDKYDILRAESIEKLNELQSENVDLYVDQAMKVTEKLTPYADALNQFADSMSSSIFGDKEDRQKAAWELLRSVAKTTTEMIRQWLIYVTTKKVLDKMVTANEQAENQARVQSSIAAGTAQLTLDSALAEGTIAAGGASGIAKEVGSKGLIGLAIGAAITAAMSALMGLVNSGINKAQSKINSIGGGKLTTGMLTYAEGNYPVLGNDGKTYNAKYEGSPKTGIYRGGARFGIFSEKKPEAIIDGDTTERILLNYPQIWRSILTIQKHGHLKEAYAIPTHATGNLKDFQVATSGVTNAVQNSGIGEEIMAQLAMSIQALNANLANGIGVNMRGKNGLDEQTAKYQRFKARNKIS